MGVKHMTPLVCQDEQTTTCHIDPKRALNKIVTRFLVPQRSRVSNNQPRHAKGRKKRRVSTDTKTECLSSIIDRDFIRLANMCPPPSGQPSRPPNAR